jgi:hypothetical protein
MNLLQPLRESQGCLAMGLDFHVSAVWSSVVNGGTVFDQRDGLKVEVELLLLLTQLLLSLIFGPRGSLLNLYTVRWSTTYSFVLSSSSVLATAAPPESPSGTFPWTHVMTCR